jgi:hypothetical protein
MPGDDYRYCRVCVCIYPSFNTISKLRFCLA